MDLVKVYILILLGVDLLLSRTDGERLCSCYTFNERKLLWPNARKSCKSSNKTLAVIESEQEWQFITNEIQNKTGNPDNEWFIGLEINSTTKRWKWINGKSLTIEKWHKKGKNPDPEDDYGMIHKEYPDGFKGSFSTFRRTLSRGWICEEETATCKGICFVHPVLTSTSPSGTSTETKTVTTQGSSTTVSTPTTAKSTYEAKSTDEAISTDAVKSTDKAISTDEAKSTDEAIPTDEAKSTDKLMSTDKVIMDDSSSSSPSVIIVAISLGAVLFVALIILIAVIILRRKKRQGKDEESAAPKSEKDHLAGSQYESVNPVEAAKLLRSANPSPDVSKTRYEPPPEDCEYAVVNKANKKRKEADLVYAQLAEFDHETDFAKPPKPPSYEPTVYADVEAMPPELPGREDPDSSEPTYANLETTGV